MFWQRPVYPLPGEGPVYDRERLVDRVGFDFFALAQQLNAGLGSLMETTGIPAEAKQALQSTIAETVADLHRLEAEVCKLCRVPGAEKAGYRGLPCETKIEMSEPEP